MRTFRMDRLPEAESRIERLVEAMARYDLQPDYQRQSEIWSEEKRQLFVDSLINEYDVPKLYFHRLSAGAAPSKRFAIVDGKQRLETIRGFLANEFALADDFTDAQADSAADAAAGKTYRELTEKHPDLAGRLTQRCLDIVVIETADKEIIEELFSRLNEAVPLNAPEKRNAFGGAMPPIIRRLVREHAFFTRRLPIENTRYKQFDLVTKFLFLADKSTFAATKKRALDDFVRGFRDGKGATKNVARARKLSKRVRGILDRMAKVFGEQDELLTSVGLVTVYFMAFLLADTDKKLSIKLTRDRLLEFDRLRRENRWVQRQLQAAVAQGKVLPPKSRVRQDLAIFDRLMQSPNDGQALEYRYRILRAFLDDKQFKDSLPKDLRRRMGQD